MPVALLLDPARGGRAAAERFPKVDLEAAEVGGQLLVRFRRDQHGGHHGFAQQPRQRITSAVSSEAQ
jgi:hypothetical protein